MHGAAATTPLIGQLSGPTSDVTAPPHCTLVIDPPQTQKLRSPAVARIAEVVESRSISCSNGLHVCDKLTFTFKDLNGYTEDILFLNLFKCWDRGSLWLTVFKLRLISFLTRLLVNGQGVRRHTTLTAYLAILSWPRQWQSDRRRLDYALTVVLQHIVSKATGNSRSETEKFPRQPKFNSSQVYFFNSRIKYTAKLHNTKLYSEIYTVTHNKIIQ